MFRKMGRNKKQILSEEETLAILQRSTSGVLCLLGDDDYTYGVPMSYSYRDGKLYFHGAKKGHKIDAMKKHDKVSFTVIETDQVVPEEYTTYFRSVIVFGKIRLIDDTDQKKDALNILVDKYSADFKEGSKEEIDSKIVGVQIMVLDIEHMSGKEAIEFAQSR